MFDNDLIELTLSNLFDWDKKAYKFDRPVKDTAPYSVVTKQDSVIICHNVLGIDKADLKLSLKKENGNSYILIEGKTKEEITGKEYSVSSKFAVDPDQLELEKISSSLKNGMLYITINKKTEKNTNKTMNISIN